MQNFGGQIRCIMGDVQVTNPAILTEQVWSIKDLFYGQIIVVSIHNGANEKKNDATIRHLHISHNAPSLLPKILRKHYFSWDGYNIQEKWKTTWKVMQNLGGGGWGEGGIQGALWEMCMQVPNPAILRNILGQESICFTAKFSWFWFTTVCLAVI